MRPGSRIPPIEGTFAEPSASFAMRPVRLPAVVSSVPPELAAASSWASQDSGAASRSQRALPRRGSGGCRAEPRTSRGRLVSSSPASSPCSSRPRSSLPSSTRVRSSDAMLEPLATPWLASGHPAGRARPRPPRGGGARSKSWRSTRRETPEARASDGEGFARGCATSCGSSASASPRSTPSGSADGSTDAARGASRGDPSRRR